MSPPVASACFQSLSADAGITINGLRAGRSSGRRVVSQYSTRRVTVQFDRNFAG
jgi:hypothetical protein